MTKEKTILRYARILVDIKLNGAFPKLVKLMDGKGRVIEQIVEYEWKPLKCTKCSMYGYADPECRKTGGRKEWRRKAQPAEGNVDAHTKNPGVEEENEH